MADDAVEVQFGGLDRGVQADVMHHYERSLPVSGAMRDEVLLAYEMNGEPLPPQHGAPLRLVVPGRYGMTSVKWLSRITAVAEPFDGPQMEFYCYRSSAEDAGEAVSLMKVRALIVPPGVPDFVTRARIVKAGPVTLRGRA